MTILGYTFALDKDFLHKLAAQAVFAAALAVLGVFQTAFTADPKYATAAAIVAFIIAAVSKAKPATP